MDNISGQLYDVRKENRKLFREKIKHLVEYRQAKNDDKVSDKFVCCFDLETTNLYGNFLGVILCGVVKPWGGEPIVFRGDRYDTWENQRSDDSQICVDLYSELKKYSVWVAHNGLAFDVNFLRTRLVEPRIEMPQPKNIDPVRIARRHLRFKFNTLEAVGDHFGYTGKTRLSPKIWNKAALDGNIPSLDYIVEHCVADVVLPEKVMNSMRYLVPKISQWGSDV